jgi:hypothetical protein
MSVVRDSGFHLGGGVWAGFNFLGGEDIIIDMGVSKEVGGYYSCAIVIALLLWWS